MSRYVSFALVGAALALSACEQPCPSQPTACSPSATLKFAVPDGTPEVYEVRVRVVENGEELSDRCLLVAPLPSDWPLNANLVNCIENSVSLYVRATAEADCDPTVTPTPDGVSIGTECTAALTGRELVLTRAGRPERIEIELSKDGVAFAPLEVEPVYADFYPDGEQCGSHCETATESRNFDELTQPAVEP